MQLGIYRDNERLKTEQRNKPTLPLAPRMHFQLVREQLTPVQRTSCLSSGLRKKYPGSFIAVLMQLFMSALAKSHTKILQVLFSLSLA